MIKFIEKHVLFPKRFGFMPYFWVFALILTTTEMFIYQRSFNWFDLSLAVLFLIFYRNNFVINPYIRSQLLAQIAIGAYFCLTFPNGGFTFFIYTAWELGSLPFKQKQFFHYYFLYLFVSLACLLGYIVLHTSSVLTNDNLLNLLVAFTFDIGSPLAARSVSNTYHRSYQTRLNNKRLETIIKQNERNRIAKDLHDNIGQSFSIITLKSELADKLIDKDPLKAHQQLKDIIQTSRDDLNLVRKIVADLNEKTIASAMVAENENLQLAQIRQISVNEDISSDWPKQTQHVIAAVIKEATTNVIRYSQANVLKFTFEEDPHNFFLEIEDNGIGLKKQHTDHSSFGITGMTGRLKSIDGQIQLISNHGLTIKISVPKKD